LRKDGDVWIAQSVRDAVNRMMRVVYSFATNATRRTIRTVLNHRWKRYRQERGSVSSALSACTVGHELRVPRDRSGTPTTRNARYVRPRPAACCVVQTTMKERSLFSARSARGGCTVAAMRSTVRMTRISAAIWGTIVHCVGQRTLFPLIWCMIY